MAIRYTGDVEVRIAWDGRSYRARIRAPGLRTSVEVDPWSIGVGPESVLPTPAAARTLTSPESYDRAAHRALSIARRKHRLPMELEGDKIVLRRRFQSPCPILRPALSETLARWRPR